MVRPLFVFYYNFSKILKKYSNFATLSLTSKFINIIMDRRKGVQNVI